MIFFTTGLLTLLAFSNAGGDHIKGGGHIKGVDHIKGGGVLPSGTKTVPQAIVQEEAIPAPYNFNIKTGAAYGTKVTREEVGDAEGRVKGTYTVSNPRGATRVVQYHADDTGFHANIKTSEPNIKTHSPSNVNIEAVPIKGGSASGVKIAQVPDELVGKIHHTAQLSQSAVAPVAQAPVIQETDVVDPTRVKSIKTLKPIKSVIDSESTFGKTRFNTKNSQLREPTTRPVVKESFVTAIKSAPSLVTQQNIKTVIKNSDPSQIRLTQQRFNPSDISVLSKGGSHILPEGIIASPFSNSATTQFAETSGARDIILYEDGKSLEKDPSNILRQNLAAFRGQGSIINRGQFRSRSQGIPKPQIMALQVLPQLGLGADIVQLNRQLQMQSEEELKRTLAGIVNVDANIQGASLSDKELAVISRRIGSGAPAPVAPAPQQRRPAQVQRIKPAVIPQRIPVAPGAQVFGAGVDQMFKYTAGRVAAGGVQGRDSSGNIGRQRIAPSSITRTSSDALNQRFGSGVIKVTDEIIQGDLGFISGDQQLKSKMSSGVATTTQLIKDGQQILGQDRIEPPIEIQQNVEPSFQAVSTIKMAGNKITLVKDSSNKFSPVEQTKVTKTVLVPSDSASQTFQRRVDKDDVSQFQVKVDDVLEESRPSTALADTIKQISKRPVQSKIALESFSQKYLQEKVPVTIPGYIPPPSFMSPFNYRVPQIRTPLVQQQERLDQILV